MTPHVWSLRLSAARANEAIAGRDCAALALFLDDETRARMQRMVRPCDAASLSGAHALARVMLSALAPLASPPTDWPTGHCQSPRSWRFERDANGRPFVPGARFDFSLTHAPGFCACAVAFTPGIPSGGDASSRNGRMRIGVDAEDINRRVNAMALARRYFHPREARFLESVPVRDRDAAFIRLWTLKEAVVKALGGGLQEGLSSFRIEAAGGALRVVGQPDRPGPPDRFGSPDLWRLNERTMGGAFALSWAIRTPHINPVGTPEAGDARERHFSDVDDFLCVASAFQQDAP